MRASLFVALLLITACSKTSDDQQSAAPVSTAPVSGWTYSASKDKMTDRIDREARLISADMLPAFGPYPAAPLRLSIYDDGSIFLGADQQFECYSDTCSVDVRFDGGKRMQIKAHELNLDPPVLVLEDSPADNVFGYSSLKDFLDLTKKSKEVLIGVPIYSQGNQVATFNLYGFDEIKLKAVQPAP